MKKLKAFTLVELIVVMAIFSMIAVGALALVKPSMELFGDTSEQEEVTACTDNIKRYIEDNLRYADRLVYCTGFERFDDIVRTEKYNYITFNKDEDKKEPLEKASVKVLEYFRDIYYPYIEPNGTYDDVYVMAIDNGTSENPKGNVKIYKADLSKLSRSKHQLSELSSQFYDTYSYNIGFEATGDAMYEMYIDVFNKKTKEDIAAKLPKHDVTSALYFININGRNIDVPIGYNSEGKLQINGDVSRFTHLEGNNPDSKKCYFIYTVPEIIIP